VAKEGDMRTEWRVTWFPPDKYKVIRKGTTEDGEDIQLMAAEAERQGWNPIIEFREVGEWETETI
jgi:hypothetical protein